MVATEPVQPGRLPCPVYGDEGVMAVGGYNGTGNLVGPVAALAAGGRLLDGTPVPPCFAG